MRRRSKSALNLKGRYLQRKAFSVLEASALIMQQQKANEAPPSSSDMHGELALQSCTRPPQQCGICRLPDIEERHVQIDQLVSLVEFIVFWLR